MTYPTSIALLNHVDQVTVGIPSTRSASGNLALDEAFLDAAEAGVIGETLRLWQFAEPTAVLGRGSKIDVEIDATSCQAENVSVVRRCSGGASIVAGPGCLMYSLVLDMRKRPKLRRLDEAHRFVMESLRNSISLELPGVDAKGTCDLTWNDRKFSGNSLRVARDHLLYHGTLLHAADLGLISRCLRTPPRQPDYRNGRDHRDFITNLPLDQRLLVQAVVRAFCAIPFDSEFSPAVSAEPTPTTQPEAVMLKSPTAHSSVSDYLMRHATFLEQTRYSQVDWTHRH